MNQKILSIVILSFTLSFTQLKAQLIQHLDASIEESVKLDESNNVSQWIDQSGKNNDAIPGIGKVRYLQGDLPWIDCGTDNNSLELFSSEKSASWLDQSAKTGGFCVAIAFKVNDLMSSNWNDLIGNSSAVASGFAMRYSSSGKVQVYLNGNLGVSAPDIAANDVVVFAFNYNGQSGAYEFWNSKNQSSSTGTKSGADFSRSEPFTLGSMDSEGRYINGAVGEIRVYDAALDPNSFQKIREEMAAKWTGYVEPISVHWRVIPENPLYPSEDVIVASLFVTDEGFAHPLPADPANNDCSATFQEALDIVGADGGGTVFIPEGQYRLDKNLELPSKVTLRGRWREITANQPATGTIIKVYAGKNNSDGKALITMQSSTGVRDLTFWHPEQSPENIIAYPDVIKSEGGPVTIENINLVNAYNGVDLSKASMCYVDNIIGTTLKHGFYADKSYAVSRFDRLDFNPDIWEWAKLPDALPINTSYKQYLLNNAVGIDIREMDGFYFTNSKVKGMNVGIIFDESPETGDHPHGDMSDIVTLGCNVGMLVNSAGGLRMTNCSLEGNKVGLKIEPHGSGMRINTCSFKGGTSAISSKSNSEMNIASCTIDGKIEASGSLKVAASEFTSAGTDVLLKNSVSSATIIGCTFADGPDIENNAPGSANIIIDHNADLGYEPAPVMWPKNMDIRRKPKTNKLFDITSFGARPNDGLDDSPAFTLAVDSANKAGGIVFVPNGTFDLSGNYTLEPGVELRGACGARHNSNTSKGLSSLIQVTGNEGDPDGTAFITLKAGSGVRGLTFFYPSQKASMLVPETIIKYPFTVRGVDQDVYVADCMFSNPYQAVNFQNANNHLLENCLMGGLNKSIYVQNCDHGRVENFHIKPDFWRDIKLGNYPQTGTGTSQLKGYCGKYLTGIWVENSTNQVVYNIFNHASHNLLRIDNSTGMAKIIGGEQIQLGYYLNGSKDFDLVLTVANVNNQGDDTGMYGVWTDKNFTGTARQYVASIEGTPGRNYLLEGGKLITVQNAITGPGERGNRNTEVKAGATLKVLSGSVQRKYAMLISDESKVEYLACEFSSGIPTRVLHDHRIEKRYNTFAKAYALTSINTGEFINGGMVLNNEGLKIENSQMFALSTSDSRMIKGARTTNGKYTISVVDSVFTDDVNENISVESYFQVNTNCKVDIYYNSTSGRKLARSESYTESNAGSPQFKRINFSINDAAFGTDTDFEIEITGESPLFNNLSISKAASPKMATKPMQWSSNPLYKKNGLEMEAYLDTINASDIINANIESVSFEKISGPGWITVSVDGIISGTPDTENIGNNEFVARAKDANGIIEDNTLVIVIEKGTGVSTNELGKTFRIYPNPAEDVLYISSLEEPTRYKVYNLTGVLVQEGLLENQKLNVHLLHQGLYLLKVDGYSTKQFIKN